MKQLIGKLLREALNKTTLNGVSGRDLSYDQKQNLFAIFKSSYEQSVGNSWTFNKFISRVDNWVFYGDTEGFITVRPQASGFTKLTGSAGNPRSVLNGLNMLTATNQPIWGVVTPEIANMVKRKGFIIPNRYIIKILFKMIPSEVLGGVKVSVNDDGSLIVNNEDTGTIKKIFIANKQYFKHLILNKEFFNRIPNVIKTWIKSLIK